MGLDMYLDKRRYVSGFGGKGEKSEREQLVITGIEGIDTKKVSYIIQEAIYWRKANAIHMWFVDNVQKGEDDCKDYYVELSQLQELLRTITNVLDQTIMVDGQVVKDSATAEKLLPTSEGFFFGGTDYDEYYFDDLQRTKKDLEDLIKNHDNSFEYYYHSSW